MGKPDIATGLNIWHESFGTFLKKVGITPTSPAKLEVIAPPSAFYSSAKVHQIFSFLTLITTPQKKIPATP